VAGDSGNAKAKSKVSDGKKLGLGAAIVAVAAATHWIGAHPVVTAAAAVVAVALVLCAIRTIWRVK
jgi:hypothetical protein